jgi:hypothetical protein
MTMLNVENYDLNKPVTGYAFEPKEDITAYELSKIVMHLKKSPALNALVEITDGSYERLKSELVENDYHRHFRKLS